MSDTNRRIDNGTFVPNKSVGTLVSTNATIGNLVVTGTLIETNTATQFSNVTVTGILGAGTVNATTSSIGNLTVTGTFINASNAATQVSSISVTGNASVGGNVVVGRDGIFCGATSGVTTLATTQYTSNVGLLYTTGINTPANIISTGIITLTINAVNQNGFVDYTMPTLVPGTPFGITFDYLYTGSADGFCAQLWFSNNATVTAIGSNADRSVSNAAIGYRFGYDIFSNQTAQLYQNANVSSGSSVSLAKSTSALPGSSWCTYTWTFDGASVWTTQVSNAANTAQVYMANVIVDPLALGIWTAAAYPNTLRMYGATGGFAALQQIRNVAVTTTTLGNVLTGFMPTLTTAQYTSNVGLLYATGSGVNTPANIITTNIVTLTNNTVSQFGYLDYTIPKFVPGIPFAIRFDYLYTGSADGFCAQLWFSDNAPVTKINSSADRSVTNAAIGYRFGYDIFTNKTAKLFQNANVSSGPSVSLATSSATLPGSSWCTYTWTFDGASVWTTQVANAANTAQVYMSNVVTDPTALGIWNAATYPNTLRMYGASGGLTALQQIRNLTFAVGKTSLGIGASFVGSGLATGAYVSSIAGTGSAPIVGNMYISFIGNGTTNGGYFDAGPQTFTRGTTGATIMAYVAFTANAATQLYEQICSFGAGVGANTIRLGRNGNSSTTIMAVSDSVGNTCVAGNGGNIVPNIPSVWTGVFTPPTTCTMYQNGALVNFNSNPGTNMSFGPSTVMPHTYIGKSQFTDPYASMNLYAFVYWNASLTSAQIVQAYTYLTTGMGSLPLPRSISAPLTILPNAPNALVGNSTYVQNVVDSSVNSASVANGIAGPLAIGWVAPSRATPYSTPTSGSLYFNGVYTTAIGAAPFTVSSLSGFKWSNQDTTMEAWVNMVAYPVYTGLAAQAPGLLFGARDNGNGSTGGANYSHWGFGVDNNGYLNFEYYNSSVNVVTTASTVSLNVWHHVAMTYTSSSGAIRMFIDGTQQTLAGAGASGNTATKQGTPNYGYPFKVGQYDGTTLNGYVADMRIVTGNVVYTGNFTVPSAPLGNAMSGSTVLLTSGVNVTVQNGNVTTMNASANSVGVTNSMTIAGNLSVVTDVNAGGNVSIAKNTNVTGNLSATDINATGNLAVTNFATVTGGINLPGNAAMTFGTPGNAAVVLTTASFANVLSYANTSDTLANVIATGNLVLSNNTANQVQSVMYVVPGLAPGVAFSANVGFTSSSYQATSNNSGDAYAIQVFPSDIGTTPLCTGVVNFDGGNGNVNGFGYMFGYIYGNTGGIQSKFGWYYYSSTGARTVYNQTFNPVLAINSTYNLYTGFDGVQTWTYKVSNSTTVITSGTATDPAALYNMSTATYPTTVRIRANSNNGVSLITANAVSIVANVGVGYASTTSNASGFIVTNSSNVSMMTVNASAPYTATLGSVIANLAATIGPGPTNVLGPTYIGNSTTITGSTTISGPTTLASVTATSASVSTSANQTAATITNTYAYTTANVLTLATTTAAGTGFNMLMATANGVNQFRVAGNGATYANGPYSSAGADYAEYFEWTDGNPGAEDRRGLTVTLTDDKIRLATVSDAPNDIIGAVSAVPTTTGDSAWSRWQGMYVLDAFGCPTTDLNPAYDPEAEYVPRSDRNEWAPIGLVGKLRVLNGRPVGSSWIRMKTDITPGVDLWLVRRPVR